MARYLIRRTLSGLLVLFVFITLVFFAAQSILPGDFASQFFGLNTRAKETLRLQLGLHLPPWQRYFYWLGNVLRGELGNSYSVIGRSGGEPVIEVLAAVLPPTLLVFGLGTALAFLIGQWLGQLTVWRGPGLFSGATLFSAVALYTAFPPWLAFLFSYPIITRLELLPPAGVYSTDLWLAAPWSRPALMLRLIGALLVVIGGLLAANHALFRATRRTLPIPAFLLLAGGGWAASWWAAGWWPYALDVMRQAVLPLTIYTLLSLGETLLIMRASVLDVLHEDYILLAEAKGLPNHIVRSRHAARNALLPVISRLTVNLPFLLTGMVMVEYSLRWQGIGSTLFYAFGRQNVPLAMGAALAVGLVMLALRLFLDLLVAALDPRVRFSAGLGSPSG